MDFALWKSTQSWFFFYLKIFSDKVYNKNFLEKNYLISNILFFVTVKHAFWDVKFKIQNEYQFNQCQSF